jgi:hypothetical protein
MRNASRRLSVIFVGIEQPSRHSLVALTNLTHF